MKGYFSRLAKQSGLSFPGQRPATTSLSAGAAKGDPALLHREETLMIPPSLRAAGPVSKAAGKIGSGMASETGVPEKPKRAATGSEPLPGISLPGVAPLIAAGGSRSEIEPARGKRPDENFPEKPEVTEIVELREKLDVTVGKEKLVRKQDAGPGAKENPRAVSLRADQGGKLPHLTTEKGEKSPGAGDGPEEISLISQTVFIPPGAPVEILPESEAEAAIVPIAEETIEISTAEETKAAEQANRQKYFSRTAKIMERSEPDAAGLQNILFQELREWAAGSPADPTPPARDAAAAAVTGAEQRELGLATHREIFQMEREPAVVSIKEKETFENDGSSGVSSGLAEQSFDLSIGTINVIIEDTAPLPGPERPSRNESAQNNSSQTKREYSRLSRNYL
jgi:hypothetical protein